jgi:hypothetical protein
MLTHDWNDEYLKLVERVEIKADNEYYLDKVLRCWNQTSSRKEEALETLHVYMKSDLYLNVYCRPAATTDAPRITSRDLIAALSEANCGKGTWEAGWRIQSVEADGRISVARDSVNFWVYDTGLRARAIRVGEPCRVWVLKELRQLMPGFYCAIGDGTGSLSDAELDSVFRVYWNLKTPTAGVSFIRSVTRELNASKIPFRAKVISNPAGYTRADAGVLYVEQKYFLTLRPLLNNIHSQLIEGLRSDVPMFSARIFPGAGLAEDPGGGLSFGQSRCDAVSRALIKSFANKATTATEKLAQIASTFIEKQIDPSRPYQQLNSRLEHYLGRA